MDRGLLPPEAACLPASKADRRDEQLPSSAHSAAVGLAHGVCSSCQPKE